ncbi:MAG: hypothetical protein LC754_19055 [Acidobacteria bacterium]|nr:hypothetical protein [Acidobacteriota bacterium]
MGLKLYCNRYAHFKDALVCSVSCVYRTRCHDFALFYDEHRGDVDARVADYYATRRERQDLTNARVTIPAIARPNDLRSLIRLEVKREMAAAFYIWIDKEDHAELLETEEVIRRAERGSKAKHIYKVSQEMELRFQLVPRKRIEKAKRTAAVEAERTQARRSRSVASKGAPAPVPFPSPVPTPEPSNAAAHAPRRARTRAAK